MKHLSILALLLSFSAFAMPHPSHRPNPRPQRPNVKVVIGQHFMNVPGYWSPEDFIERSKNDARVNAEHQCASRVQVIGDYTVTILRSTPGVFPLLVSAHFECVRSGQKAALPIEYRRDQQRGCTTTTTTTRSCPSHSRNPRIP